MHFRQKDEISRRFCALATVAPGAILTGMVIKMLRVMMVCCLALPAASGQLWPGEALALSTEEQNAQGLRDCDCRAQGVLWRQGQEICMNGRMQICGMDQNVSTWITTGRNCPTSLNFSPRPQMKAAAQMKTAAMGNRGGF
jgi:hypothetical protein